jgi:hypothetical protein
MRLGHAIADHRGMTAPRKQLGVLGKELRTREVDADAPIDWACSAKGWNCCVDKSITVYPYDLIRLRHTLGRSAQELINDGTVTFTFVPSSGALTGILKRRSYGQGHEACIFLDEVTPSELRSRAEVSPGSVRALPDFVRRAADSNAADWRVAGLCGVHTGRPLACRSFPFARQRVFEAGVAIETRVNQVNYCGSCALGNVTTTPREVLLDQGIEDYWRAGDVFEELTVYLRSLGLASLHLVDGYNALPIDQSRLTQLWASLYVPEANAEIVERWGESWRESDDPARDLEIYRVLVERALGEAETLVEASDVDRAALGLDLERGRASRPNLDALLDPSRALLPQVTARLEERIPLVS